MRLPRGRASLSGVWVRLNRLTGAVLDVGTDGCIECRALEKTPRLVVVYSDETPPPEASGEWHCERCGRLMRRKTNVVVYPHEMRPPEELRSIPPPDDTHA